MGEESGVGGGGGGEDAGISLAQFSQLIPKPQEQPSLSPSLLKGLVGAP